MWAEETAWSEPSIAHIKPNSEPDLPPQRLVSCWAHPHLWLGSWRLFILTGVWLTPRVDLFPTDSAHLHDFEWKTSDKFVTSTIPPLAATDRSSVGNIGGSPPEHAVFRSSLWEGKARVCFWFWQCLPNYLSNVASFTVSNVGWMSSPGF